MFVHHSGKSGDQRGASKREDTLDTVVKLIRPAEYEPSQGAAFEIIFEKARFLKGGDVARFEVRLSVNPITELQEWIVQDSAQSNYDRIVTMANEGLTQTEIASELGLHKSNVCRNLKKAADQGLLRP
ncbi:MAG: helix-turn-helix domain-containing protein [Desulfuromonadales bacterium]